MLRPFAGAPRRRSTRNKGSPRRCAGLSRAPPRSYPGRVSEPTSERPTDNEFGSKAGGGEDDAVRDPSSVATLRSGADDQPTLRLGSSPDALPPTPPWRARYEDLGEIARGGMSSIRAVYDQLIHRRVAMKVHDRERDPSGLAQFIEEARITGQLDHPNIIPVHDVQFDDPGLPTRFTMKLVEGETLTGILDRLGPAALEAENLERLLNIVLKVCDAVAFAHSRGVIHCDLKPSNVLVGSFGEVYLTDWGVALRTDRPREDASERPTRPYGQGVLYGTPAYMAPEQAWGRREDIDERTDVHGVGGILYAILTLSPPHDGGEAQADLELAKRGIVREPTQVARGRQLPPGLCRIAMRALAADPAHRHPSIALLRADIERFLRGGGWLESVRLPKGTVVLREGDAPDAAYILLEGQCELYRTVEGRQRFVRLLSPREVFGETSIFGDSTRTASIVAATDVSLVRVTRAALEREIERSDWLQAFVRALAERFIELDRRVRELEK